jgi:uncharacterized protein (TIGR02145 family)
MKIKNKFPNAFLVAMCFILMLSDNCTKHDDSNFPQVITDIDGNIYHTIKIGSQIWIMENLKTTHYRNGDPIPTSEYDWGETTGEYCNYFNDSNIANTYGRLYNWYAVKDNRNLAPAGWHVPTDAEWTTLTDYLTNNGYGYEGSGNDIAKSMAVPSGWKTSSIAGTVGNDAFSNNNSGFTALPGGRRYFIYWAFIDFSSCGYWWSTTESGIDEAWNRHICFSDSTVVKESNLKQSAYSVRCIKD